MNRTLSLYLLVLALACGLYISTAAPSVLWQDSGMYQYRILHNDIQGSLGLALAHPLYHMIGIAIKYIFPGDLARNINLISAISAALTVANIFLLIRLWLGSFWPAIIAAATAAFSHTLWQHAAIAEVYATATAFITTELLLVFAYIKTSQKKYLYLLALTNGLALANHLFAVLSLACWGVFVLTLIFRKKLPAWCLAIMALLWITGALPYEYLIAKQYLATGDLAATIRSALFGQGFSSAVLNSHLTARIIKENIMFLAMNYPTPNIILFFAGLWAVFKIGPRTWAVLLIALTAIFYIFAFRYTVPDRYAFFMPFYCVVPIFVGAAFAYIFKPARHKIAGPVCLILALMPIPVYMALPSIAKKAHVSLGTTRVIPYRDDYIYFLQPWQHCNTGPQKFATQALTSIAPNSVIYADGTTVYALLYEQQLYKIAPSVTVLTPHGSVHNFDPSLDWDKIIQQRPVYVVSPVKGYIPADWLEKYNFQPAGVLYRVELK